MRHQHAYTTRVHETPYTDPGRLVVGSNRAYFNIIMITTVLKSGNLKWAAAPNHLFSSHGMRLSLNDQQASLQRVLLFSFLLS